VQKGIPFPLRIVKGFRLKSVTHFESCDMVWDEAESTSKQPAARSQHDTKAVKEIPGPAWILGEETDVGAAVECARVEFEDGGDWLVLIDTTVFYRLLLIHCGAHKAPLENALAPQRIAFVEEGRERAVPAEPPVELGAGAKLRPARHSQDGGDEHVDGRHVQIATLILATSFEPIIFFLRESPEDSVVHLKLSAEEQSALI
jgi:hypothetical protein